VRPSAPGTTPQKFAVGPLCLFAPEGAWAKPNSRSENGPFVQRGLTA
jgi:hypothetical protein